MKVQNVKIDDAEQYRKGGDDASRSSYSDKFVEALLEDVQNLRSDRDYLKKLTREHTADLASDAFAAPHTSEEAQQAALDRLKRWNKRLAYYHVHYAVVDIDELSDKLTNEARERLQSSMLW